MSDDVRHGPYSAKHYDTLDPTKLRPPKGGTAIQRGHALRRNEHETEQVAYIGSMSSYEWFDWACRAGICMPGDQVTHCTLEIGIEDIVRVTIEKYAPASGAAQRLPPITDVQKVE